jgi:hypothetical protein
MLVLQTQGDNLAFFLFTCDANKVCVKLVWCLGQLVLQKTGNFSQFFLVASTFYSYEQSYSNH